MISPSTTKSILQKKLTNVNLFDKRISATNDGRLNSDKDITIRNSSRKRLKTSHIDVLDKMIRTTDRNGDLYISQQRHNRHLAEQFFFQSHPFSDLTLITQDKKFYVDKSVLSTVSNVFQSYFQDETTESIDIVDVSSNDMIELLQFLYPQFQCTIHYQNVTSLLLLAHRFEIHSILNACRAFILLYLSKFTHVDTHSTTKHLIDGSHLTISTILDSLCIWFREFFYMNDEIVWESLLKKLCQCNITNIYSTKGFNELEEKLQYTIVRARAKYVEKSCTSTSSSLK